MNTQSQSLATEKQSIALLLERQKQNIIDQWTSKVRDLYPVAQKQNRLALLNALPQLIDEIANALSLIGFGSDSRKEVSKEHAQQRANLGGYNLKQILSEMRVLRETIFEVLERESGLLAQRERDIILDSIEKGIIVTGAEFMRIQIEERDQELDETKEAVKQVEIDLYDSLSTIDKLESEQRLRDLFVATLSHDLRTPLTAVKLNAQLIRRRLTEPDYIDSIVAKIEAGLNRADNMIETLLDANQIRVGRALSFEMKEYDLVEQIAELVKESSELNQRKIIFNKSSQSLVCYLAAEKIGRAVENLLTNAIKYGDKERPITVSVLEGDNKVKISVHNYGRPIPEGDQSLVFEPFFRANTARVGSQKGWGLGLTLVRGIVEAHGGHVDLKSNSSDGTTFSIIVPRDARVRAK